MNRDVKIVLAGGLFAGLLSWFGVIGFWRAVVLFAVVYLTVVLLDMALDQYVEQEIAKLEELDNE